MTIQNTIARRLRLNPLPSLQAGAVRLFSATSGSSNTKADAHRAERPFEFSYDELAARGPTRDDIGRHAVWRYMGYY